MIHYRLLARFMIVGLCAFVILAVVGLQNQLLASDTPSASSASQSGSSATVQWAENLSATFREAGQTVRPAMISIYSCKPGPLPAVSRNPAALDFVGNDAFVALAYPLAFDPTGDALVEEFLGNGVIVATDGIAVTSHNAVEGVKRVRVKTADEQEYSAKVIKTDAASGVALLKIEGSNFPVVTLAGAAAQSGDWVAAVGALPHGEHLMSLGVISARNQRPGTSGGPDFLLMTDAAVDTHNNGGALVNLNGEVVGINTLTSSSRRFGFAVPIERVHALISSRITAKDTKKDQVTGTAAPAASTSPMTKVEVPAAWRDFADRVNGLVAATAERCGMQDWLPRSLQRTNPNKSKTSVRTD